MVSKFCWINCKGIIISSFTHPFSKHFQCWPRPHRIKIVTALLRRSSSFFIDWRWLRMLRLTALFTLSLQEIHLISIIANTHKSNLRWSICGQYRSHNNNLSVKLNRKSEATSSQVPFFINASVALLITLVAGSIWVSFLPWNNFPFPG